LRVREPVRFYNEGFKREKRAGGVAQVVECLPSKWKEGGREGNYKELEGLEEINSVLDVNFET
jgi:hypothetical protein